MANEYFKATELSANVFSEVAKAPNDRGMDFHITVVNQTKAAAQIRAFIHTSNSAAKARYVEFDRVLKGIGFAPFVRGPIRVPAGYGLYLRSTQGDCNVVAVGQTLRPAEA